MYYKIFIFLYKIIFITSSFSSEATGGTDYYYYCYYYIDSIDPIYIYGGSSILFSSITIFYKFEPL